MLAFLKNVFYVYGLFTMNLKVTAYCLTLFVFATLSGKCAAAEPADSFRLHADLPYLNKNEKLALDVYYNNDSSFKGQIEIHFYKFSSPTDSICILQYAKAKSYFKKGLIKLKVIFNNGDTNAYYDQAFYEILDNVGEMPAGDYKMYINVKNNLNSAPYRLTYLQKIDTALGVSSQLRKKIENSVWKKTNSVAKKRIHSDLAKSTEANKNKTAAIKRKIERVAKKNGLTTSYPDEYSVDFYYGRWFVSRYKIEPINIQDSKEDVDDPVNGDMDKPSLFSQHKKKNAKKQDETRGEIGVSTNASTDQEPNSGVDNNYYELKGRLEMPVCNIPIEIEGLYTSQDAHREIKSSYFRVHYDVEKMKDGLSKSITSYNNSFNEKKGKSAGVDQVYTSGISKLKSRKNQLQNEINASQKDGTSAQPNSKNVPNIKVPSDKKDTTYKNYHEDYGDSTDIANTQKSKKNKPDVAGGEKKVKNQKDSIEKKKKEVEEIDKKIEKYETLLSQHKNTMYFDSVAGYSKTKNISGSGDQSYKQMAKSGANLLPDGKAKSFISGVTNMNAGMFYTSQSNYAMNGQMMRGADFGYDFGFFEAGVAAGKTEYAGRDGSLDKYTFYSGKLTMKPAKKQKVNFIYYGYTPDKKVISGDGFFSNTSVSVPGFFQRVNIYSASYEGEIGKYVNVIAEGAFSWKEADRLNNSSMPDKDMMAYRTEANANIPNTAIQLQTEYERTGKDFVNATLPVLMSGTERYKMAARDDFFHSYVTAGVEVNRLLQHNFLSEAKNTKWGFDVKTNSKRYPNLALSYKPFSTFHSFSDTLSVPQKPMIGSVWTGKATYQIRRHQQSVRFALLYNKCLTTFDTTKYGSRLMQFSTFYSIKSLSTGLTIGETEVYGTKADSISKIPGRMEFAALSGSYNINRVTLSAGQEAGMTVFGMCKYATNATIVYLFKKPSLIARLNFRYATYRLGEKESWKNIYAGNIDLTYRFKSRKDKK